MDAAEIRFLFGYDRWATRKVLDAARGVDPSVWGATGIVGERGLGSILVHMLGAHQRWRHAFLQDGLEPRPEEEPLQSVDELRDRWDAELHVMEAWLDTLSDGFVAYVHDGIPVWQMLLHLANHGTQHRSEAALLLTAVDHSPGDLDLIDYAESLGAPAA
jgi:uncharacterized damage-inducible protein DinB